MNELTLTLLRLGFLLLLWLLVLAIVAVIRRDLFGTQVQVRSTPRRPGRSGRAVVVPSGAARTLIVTAGSLRGTTITLGQAPILIGRAPECTLVLDDDFASGRHARFSLQGAQWILEDLGSTNGTYLGRSKVSTPVPVEPGVPVRIGHTVLELRR